MPDAPVPAPEEGARYRDDVEVGEVVVRDLERRGIVQALCDDRFLSLFWSWVALSIRGRTRAIGQEAAAQGRDKLSDGNLVSTRISL